MYAYTINCIYIFYYNKWVNGKMLAINSNKIKHLRLITKEKKRKKTFCQITNKFL